MSRKQTAAAILTLGLLAMGCSDSGDDADTASTTTRAEVPTTTVATTSTIELESSTTTSTAIDDSFHATLLAGAWSDNVMFEVGDDGYTLRTDGVPSHVYPDQWAAPRDPVNISADDAMIVGDVVATQQFSFDLPLSPTYSDTVTPTELGTIGVMVSGAVLYNPYEGGGGVALDANFDLDGVSFIDACNGHPEGSGIYHYHGVPNCITDTLDREGEHSTMIGVLLDGFPIYGPNDTGGAPPTDLDACSGHVGPTPEFPDGIYHYHLSESAPYSIDCYHGVVSLSATGGETTPPIDDVGGDDAGPAPDNAPDLSRAAATLGVSEAELRDALGPPPPDFAAAADALGITVDDLMAALG